MSKIIGAINMVCMLAFVTSAVAKTCPVWDPTSPEANDPANPAARTLRQWCGCPMSPDGKSEANAIDLSHRVTADARLLDAAKANGVTTVFRYYDWLHRPGTFVKLGSEKPWEVTESGCTPGKLCKKVITKEEIAAIHGKGMNIGIVFQHDMSNPDTWLDSKRAGYDADRALILAKELGQPKGTAIYFGVDGVDQNFFSQRNDPTFGIEYIRGYFRKLNEKFKGSGYDIGVYGSGLVCDSLMNGNEPGHTGSAAPKDAGAWTIKQCRTRLKFQGSTMDVDPDVINPSQAEFGQWRPVPKRRGQS